MYTLSEFRQQTRKALNEALTGNEVLIKRFDEVYELKLRHVSESGFMPKKVLETLPKPKGSSRINLEATAPTKNNVFKELQDKLDVRQRFEGAVCKVHGTPLDDRGKCLMKGCKYA